MMKIDFTPDKIDFTPDKPTPAPKSTVAPPTGFQPRVHGVMNNIVGAVGEPLLQMATGAIAKPVSDIAALGDIAYGMMRGGIDPRTGVPYQHPAQLKQEIQQAMTYQPRTEAGHLASKVLSLPGEAVNYVGQGAQNLIAPPGTQSTARNIAGSVAHEGINDIPLLLGLKFNKLADAKFTKMQDALNVAKARNARIDAVAQQANKLGLPIPTKRTGWRAKIFGETNVNAPNLVKVKEASDEAIRQDFNLPTDTPIDVQTMEKIREKNAKPYRALNNYLKTVKTKANVPSDIVDASGKPVTTTQQINGIAPDSRFKNTLKALYEPMNRLYQSNTETFKSFASPLKMLKQDMEPKDGFFHGGDMVQRIKTMRQEASKDFRSGDTNKEAEAFVKIKVANALEDLVDRTLKQNGQGKLLDDLKKARVQYAKSYEYENAMRPDGSLDLRKFSKLANEKKLTGNAKVLAQYGAKFPQMAKAIPGTKGAVGPFDYLLYAMHRPSLAVAHIASHLAPDFVSKENYLPPSYTARVPISGYLAPPLMATSMAEKKK